MNSFIMELKNLFFVWQIQCGDVEGRFLSIVRPASVAQPPSASLTSWFINPSLWTKHLITYNPAGKLSLQIWALCNNFSNLSECSWCRTCETYAWRRHKRLPRFPVLKRRNCHHLWICRLNLRFNLEKPRHVQWMQQVCKDSKEQCLLKAIWNVSMLSISSCLDRKALRYIWRSE